MRIVIAVMMILHGGAHLVGFLTPWRLIPADGGRYRTTVMSGHVDLGGSGIRAFGLMWLLAAAGFWIAAAGALANSPWWVPMALATAMVSLCMSVVSLPDSRIGVPINVAIIAALVAVERFGHL